jgi:NAD(P)-dependent dehydrogenase (short-subunit alcohol dehydrogenase family)
LGIQRIGEVEDISNAALFFANNKSNYITGEILTVCGKTMSKL